MTNASKKYAVLLNQGCQGSPVISLNVPVELQFCVDAGAAAAYTFFDDRTAIGLHDHIAASMHAFMQSMRSTPTHARQTGPQSTGWQGCTDAFAAGYLGRIQQELRCIRTRVQGDVATVLVPRNALH